MKGLKLWGIVFALAAVAAAMAPLELFADPAIERISVASDGNQGNSYASYSSISSDGRYVAFHSGATNLVEGDTNKLSDIFVHDRKTGVTSRVSVASDGSEANAFSVEPSISGNGRIVAFQSRSSNLAPGKTTNVFDIFVHDSDAGITKRVSATPAPEGGQGDSSSLSPNVSEDGRFIAFHSDATNLAPGDTNGATDVFVHDLLQGTTALVSVNSEGSQGDHSSLFPSISSDGRYVVFQSWADNLAAGEIVSYAHIYVRDRVNGAIMRVSVSSEGIASDGDSRFPAISRDGRFVDFSSEGSNLVPGDSNDASDIFVHDLEGGTTVRVSLDSDGSQGRRGPTSMRRGSYAPRISSDGRFVTFLSEAAGLVHDDKNDVTDVFLHDVHTGITKRLSIAVDGTPGSTSSALPAISQDGRFIVFHSTASNLVPGSDINGSLSDVFVTSNPLESSATSWVAVAVLWGIFGTAVLTGAGFLFWRLSGLASGRAVRAQTG